MEQIDESYGIMHYEEEPELFEEVFQRRVSELVAKLEEEGWLVRKAANNKDDVLYDIYEPKGCRLVGEIEGRYHRIGIYNSKVNSRLKDFLKDLWLD